MGNQHSADTNMAGVIDLAERHMSGPIVWGTNDCCTGVCDIFRARHGFDPMLKFRGTYSTRFEAYDVIRSCGGWLKLTHDTFTLCYSMSETDRPRWGDIGLLRQDSAHLAFGRALVSSAGKSGWIGRTKMGYCLLKSVDVEKVWTWRR